MGRSYNALSCAGFLHGRTNLDQLPVTLSGHGVKIHFKTCIEYQRPVDRFCLMDIAPSLLQGFQRQIQIQIQRIFAVLGLKALHRRQGAGLAAHIGQGQGPWIALSAVGLR